MIDLLHSKEIHHHFTHRIQKPFLCVRDQFSYLLHVHMFITHLTGTPCTEAREEHGPEVGQLTGTGTRHTAHLDSFPAEKQEIIVQLCQCFTIVRNNVDLTCIAYIPESTSSLNLCVSSQFLVTDHLHIKHNIILTSSKNPSMKQMTLKCCYGKDSLNLNI